MIAILIIISFLVLLVVHQFYWRRRGLPPGPTPWPIFGNLLTVAFYEPGYEAYKKWRAQFGPVFTVFIGPEPVVVIADYATMKETIIRDGDTFADRFQFPYFIEMFRGGHKYGIVDGEGERWMEARRTSLQILRDFGLGKPLMQERVMVEVSDLMKKMEGHANDGKPFTISGIFVHHVASIINLLLFSYRFDSTNEHQLVEVNTALKEIMAHFGNPLFAAMMMYPQMKSFPPFSSYDAELQACRNKILGFLRNQINQHREHIDFTSDDANDICERYLKDAEEKRKTGSGAMGTMTAEESEQHLVHICFDIWSAGMETTATTLNFSAAYLMHHPDVQDRVYHEIENAVSADKQFVEMDDRVKLPYTNAVIMETQRCANLLPQNLFRATRQPTVLGGCLLPAGTSVLPQMSVVLYDETVFPAPHEFRPERFVDAATGQLKKVDELIPFSCGKRQCLGEALARLELFLFLANLLRKYKIVPERADRLPSLYKKFSIVVNLQPYLCRLEKR